MPNTTSQINSIQKALTLTDLREAFFNNAQETFVLFDKDFNIIDVNDAFVRALHLRREDVVGKNVTEVSPGIAQTKRYQVYQHVLATGQPVTLDEERKHPSLGNFVTRICVFRVGDGLGLAATDISDIREAVDELQTIIYKSSHDLRAPIASMLGLINIAETDLDTTDTTRLYLDKLRTQAEQLDLILSRLLETTRIRDGHKIIHLIDFNNLIDEVLKSIEHMPGFRDIAIERVISVKQKFYSDKSFIIPIFQNLIDNAIKYKKENILDPTLNISVTEEGDRMKITFSDNGIGIAEDAQKHIFKMFFRATSQSSGSGLGLYIVKQCIKKLNGHITLNSLERIGTSFTVILPNEKE